MLRPPPICNHDARMVGLQRSVSELLQSLWLWICMNCMTRTLGAMISRAHQDLEMLPDT